MDAHTAAASHGGRTPDSHERRSGVDAPDFRRAAAVLNKNFVLQLAAAFLAYYVAGKLGQATTNIRSGNLGPVWPASGIMLAALLAYGYRVWPALAVSAFLVAFQSPVSAFTAAGQAIGATTAAVTGTYCLRRLASFDPRLSRLRDAMALILIGGFGSALISSTIGSAFLYATGLPYSGLAAAWLIYWLGDATGVLLVTPLVFTLPALFELSRKRAVEFALLLTLLTGACFVIFGDLPLFPIRLHVLAFAVLPFVMWAATGFGIGGASVSVFLIATMATLLTALGHGPFAGNTPFINAALLDVLFTVLAVSGLAFAAVISERERAKAERRAQEVLSSVSQRLVDAQELERTRLARELHDDIGQRLSLLTVNLTEMRNRVSGSPQLHGQMHDLQQRAIEIAADVQALSHRLHSSKLELLGLPTATRIFCEEFADQQQAKVNFAVHGLLDDVPRDVSLCLFRVLQEALHNAAKHSGVRQFDVQLWAADDHVQLAVADQGKGFDVDAARSGRGIGLLSMGERIRIVRGTLSIESRHQLGSTIRARVPLGQSE
jgi:signal transduction histidine kinase